jgi:nucleoside-diphosphate-sugar epimerase
VAHRSRGESFNGIKFIMDRLLIVGCGDIARRALPALALRHQLAALARDPARLPAGISALTADLDDQASLVWRDISADNILYCAPPGDAGTSDLRLRNLIAAFSARRMVPRRLVYIGTSGVYGDCGGAWVDETRPVNPQTPRARRRADAERALSEWSAVCGAAIVILRVPGIYAADRLPLERLRRGTPVLRTEDDIYTNHIHADDLAAICTAALDPTWRAGVYNVADDSALKMGDWFDLVADRAGLPRPPRIAPSQAPGAIPEALLSFMNESRRLCNRKIKGVPGMVLRYPTVYEGVPVMTIAEKT